MVLSLGTIYWSYLHTANLDRNASAIQLKSYNFFVFAINYHIMHTLNYPAKVYRV